MGGSFRRWGFVAALALARVAFGFQFQSVASLGPELIARFRLDYAAMGTLIGLYMLPGIVVALPGGLLGRRFGERIVVGGGLALMALGSAWAGMATGPGRHWAGPGRRRRRGGDADRHAGRDDQRPLHRA